LTFAGLLHTVTGSDGVEYAENTLYEPTGKIGQIDHQDGIAATRYTYDSWSTKLLGIATDAHSNPIQTKAYHYSRTGDITSIEDQQAGITYNYTYDKLHRLLTETNTGTYAPITYTYSAIGNISSKVIGANTFTYAYSLSAHKHAVSKITLNGTNYSYTYDANGNMTKGYDFTDLANIATRNITYNTDNMPKKVVHTRYGTTNITYDAAGGRAKKVGPSGTTYYIGEHFEKINGGTIKYIFAGDIRIAKVTSSNTYYFHKDHLGSSAVMTDSSGNVVETTEYMPFGEMRVHTGSTVTNYKFTDQELDPETGLYYYGARYYDPVIGRFISPDSIVQDPFDPQMLNRYSYCRNNPLRYIDPDGHGFWAVFIPIIKVVVAIVAGYLADRLGANSSSGGSVGINNEGNTNYTSYNPSTGEEYRSSGGGGSGGTSPSSVIGNGGQYYQYGYHSYSGSGDGYYNDSYDSMNDADTKLTIYLRYGDDEYNVRAIRNSVNDALYPSRSQNNYSSGRRNTATGREVDWIDVTLAGASSGAALVALGAPHPYVKLGAEFVGTASTGFSVLRSIYKYNQGKMTKGELALKISLDVTPIFGKRIAGKVGEATIGVLEHQMGLFEAGKSIFYDPNR